MWVEAILSEDDLVELLRRFFPVEIHFGDKGALLLSDPTEIGLVPDEGLRLVCKSKVRLPVLGIGVPVTLHSIAAMIRPEVAKTARGERLVFKLALEHVDVAVLPTFVDDKITDFVNRELAEKQVELSWSYSETLSHVFELPPSLHPLSTFDLKVSWGRVRITSEAMVLAVCFQADVTRRAEEGLVSRADT